MSQPQKRTSGLSPEESRALLASLLRKRAGQPRTVPVSYAQRRFWFLDQLDQGNAAYNIPAAVRLTGELNTAALARTFAEILRRHEILRTTFAAVDGDPRQVIHPATEFVLPVQDLSEWPRPGQGTEAERLATAEVQRPFDLRLGPLLRVSLLKLRNDDHVLLLSVHHIIGDGWSMNILMRELEALYNAFSAGQPSPLSELPIQYADYARWQRRWLDDGALDEQLSYWRQKLNGARPFLSFPASRPRPAVQTFRGAAQALRFSSELSASIKALSHREGVTSFMTLLAGFQILLYRYTGQEDIVVGTPIASRNRAEVEILIGLFANTLVLRTDLAGNPSFRELLGRVKEVALGAYAHQDVPFEKLVEELQPERNLSYAPLFQVMFSLQSASSGSPVYAGLTLQPVAHENLTAKFDVTLSIVDSEQGLAGAIEYNSDLFGAPAILRLATHFQTLLISIVADAEQRISGLPMLREAERWQLVVEWNENGRDCGSELCLQEMIEERAEEVGDSVAVVSVGEQMSYWELNEGANQLAHYLKRMGVGAESVVGVCLKRSVELIVALVGILKAGGAYVPLDPGYPRERLSFMVEDGGARVLVTEGRLGESLSGSGLRVVAMDREGEEIGACERSNPGNTVSGENLAYVIYTSGSSGIPKGVGITHQSAVALVEWARGQYGEGELERVLAGTSICFDLSIFEIFVPLASGNRVVLAENVVELGGLGEREQVTLMNSVPSAVKELVREGVMPGSVRTVNLAGEALGRELVEELYGSGRVERVYNLYGPSEDTTYTTYGLMEGGDEGAPVIGRPIGKTQVYVLDGEGELVGVGVVGELHIGGAGLARGYVGRGEITAERFVPDCVSGREGERLYRTGDVVRYRGDGNLEYLGRADQQVKVRGFRIELGEIEARLKGHEEIKEAVVLAKEDERGDARLVAYVVLEAEGESEKVAGAELRRYLKKWLPEHMVPGVFMRLRELPLTANGKVDRRALPDPEHTLMEGLEQEARTPVEEIIGGIWKEVLGIDREIGVRDKFFELGGHSLLATRVISRIREAFGVEIGVRVLFERATISELAEKVEWEWDEDGGQKVATKIRRAEREWPIPLSFAQQRLWFLDQLEPQSSFYNIPAAVRFSGQLDVDALEQTLNEIVRRHEVLRTRFIAVNGEAVQVIGEARGIDLEVSDLREIPRKEREEEGNRLGLEEARKAFDLSSGPAVRAKLLRLDEDEEVILLTMHHIVSDGWSMGLLVEEVSKIYETYRRGEGSPLGELAIQYGDYAVWQREWLSGEVLEEQLRYWKKQLAGAARVLELSTDRARPAIQSYRGGSESFNIGATIWEGLKRISQEEGLTLFMTALAGFKALLYRYSGQEDIVVGTPIAGRTRGETEKLIGFFVNTLVLRTRVRGERKIRELLREVREVALGAYMHQDLPFEKLVEELQPERDLSHGPMFQVMFALENAPRAAGLEGGVANGQGKAVTARVEAGTSKFDLTMGITEVTGGLSGSVSYSTDLFDRETIERMASHYLRLLEALASNPDRQISEVQMLSEAEIYQLVVSWNDTRREYGSQIWLRDNFEGQVERGPEVIAVVYGEQQVSYKELNQRANRVGHHLIGLGIRSEEVVGLCTERSVEMVVGFLGILKSGGAYLPLDPTYPPERISFMLRDCSVRVVLTQGKWRSKMAGETTGQVCLDDDWPGLEPGPGANPDVPISGEHLAYVIYTSGSTGKPKGVQIEHRQVSNYCRVVGERLGLAVGSRFAMVQPFTFDSSLTVVYPALGNGGCLHLISTEQAVDAERLGKYFRETGIQVVKIAPSHLAALIREAGGNDVLPSGHLVMGGEALPREFAQELEGMASCKIFNHYGPTETTVGVLTHEVTKESKGRKQTATVPLGRPLGNTRLYVGDRSGQIQPLGVPGELYIGGRGVGRGYLNRADLTAERFVPDGYSQRRGGRLYRTGDVARYSAVADLEFLGRADDQVKVRGYRIELREVEAALKEREGVKEAVVVVADDGSRGKRLVAYIVGAKGTAIEVGELRRGLKEILPEHMVPSAFVVMREMPLTPHGKVDRRALPAPGQEPDTRGTRQGPRTALEEELAGIWTEVLGVEEVGMDDNFFDMGGHSLMAIRLISRSRLAFGFELPLRLIFEAPTVAEMSEHIQQARQDSAGLQASAIEQTSQTENWSPLVEIQKGARRPPLFLVHPVGGGVFCYLNLARQLGSEYTIYGFQARGLDEGQAPQSQIEEMAAYYIESLRRVQPVGPYLLGGWSMGGLVAFEMAQQLSLSGDELAFLGLMDSTIPSSGSMLAGDENQALLGHFATDLGLGLDSLTSSLDEVLQLDFDKQLNYVLGLARSANIVPDDCSLPYLRNLFQVFRSNFRAVRSYRARVYPGKITLLAARDRPASASDPEPIWSALALGGLDTYSVPGDHYGIFKLPHLQALAAQLRACLFQVTAAGLMSRTTT